MNRKLNDIQCFNQFFQQNQQKYLIFARSYVRNPAVAEDLFMESITALWENRLKWAENSNLNALLLTIIKNKALNYLAREKRRLQAQTDIESHHLRELNLRISTLEASNPERIFQNEVQRIVDRTLHSMPEQTRRIFILSRNQNLSNKEIADSMQLSVKTVEFHITKTLRTLKLTLKDYLLSLFFL